MLHHGLSQSELHMYELCFASVHISHLQVLFHAFIYYSRCINAWGTVYEQIVLTI